VARRLSRDIEALITDAAKRTPWVLEVITGEGGVSKALEEIFRDQSPEDMHREFYVAVLNVVAAQTNALVRLAETIEALEEPQGSPPSEN
jgi:hypothetical protein